MKPILICFTILMSIGISPLIAQLPVGFQKNLIKETKFHSDSTCTFLQNGVPYNKTIYDYNENENHISVENYDWDPAKNTWMEKSKTSYQYDENENIILYGIYNWNQEKKQWIGVVKEIYQYDIKGNQRLYENYNWDTKQNNWKKHTTTLYESGYFSNSPFKVRILGYESGSVSCEYAIVDNLSGYYKPVYINFPSNGRDENWDDYTQLEYDHNGNLISCEWRWYSDENCQTSDKISCSYNHKNQLVEILADLNHYHGIRKYVYDYDDLGNIILFELYWWDEKEGKWKVLDKSDFGIQQQKQIAQYNEKGQLILEKTYFADTHTNAWNIPDTKTLYKYDELGNETLVEIYKWNQEKNAWEKQSKTVYESDYDNNNQILCTEYRWNSISQEFLPKRRNIYYYDTSGNKSMNQIYSWIDEKWSLISYTIYYPNLQTSDLKIENDQQIVSDEEGNLKISFEIPKKKLISGRLVISFPNNIILDSDKTKLSPELTDALDLLITPLENNSWLIEIKPKDPKNTIETDLYKRILNIAYIIESKLQKETYDILINKLNFELSDGTCIIEESRFIRIEINCNKTSINPAIYSDVKAFIFGSALIIDSPYAETVDIYSVSGIKVHSIRKDSGKTIINIDPLSQNIWIIKGRSGWKIKITS